MTYTPDYKVRFVSPMAFLDPGAFNIKNCVPLHLQMRPLREPCPKCGYQPDGNDEGNGDAPIDSAR